MIKSVRVSDPRTQGGFTDPLVVITVDTEVEETGDPITGPTVDGIKTRIIPCGLFYAIEVFEDGDWYDASNPRVVGWVNNGFEFTQHQLLPVRVNHDTYVLDLYAPVTRVRRMVRNKTDNRYEIIQDDGAGLIGLLKWRVERRNPVCYGGAKPRAANCENKVAQTIIVRNTHLTLCPHHVIEHQRLFTERRNKAPNGS